MPVIPIADIFEGFKGSAEQSFRTLERIRTLLKEVPEDGLDVLNGIVQHNPNCSELLRQLERDDFGDAEKAHVFTLDLLNRIMQGQFTASGRTEGTRVFVSTKLSEHLEIFYKLLATDNNYYLKVCLRGLTHIVKLNGGLLILDFNFSKQSFQRLLNRRKKRDGAKAEPEKDIRTAYLSFAKELLSSKDPLVINAALQVPKYIQPMFKNFTEDYVPLVIDFLSVLKENVINNKAVKRAPKKHLFNGSGQRHLSELLEHENIDIASKAAEVLEMYLTNPYFHRNNAKEMDPLHHFCISLRPLQKPQQNLIVAILKAHPHMYTKFLFNMGLVLYPRLSMAWIQNVQFLCKLIAIERSKEDDIEAIALNKSPGDLCIPLKSINKTFLTQGLLHSDPDVRRVSIYLLHSILKRADTIITILASDEDEHALENFERYLLNQLPDLNTLTNLLPALQGKTVNAPPSKSKKKSDDAEDDQQKNELYVSEEEKEEARTALQELFPDFYKDALLAWAGCTELYVKLLPSSLQDCKFDWSKVITDAISKNTPNQDASQDYQKLILLELVEAALISDGRFLGNQMTKPVIAYLRTLLDATIIHKINGANQLLRRFLSSCVIFDGNAGIELDIWYQVLLHDKTPEDTLTFFCHIVTHATNQPGYYNTLSTDLFQTLFECTRLPCIATITAIHQYCLGFPKECNVDKCMDNLFFHLSHILPETVPAMHLVIGRFAVTEYGLNEKGSRLIVSLTRPIKNDCGIFEGFEQSHFLIQWNFVLQDYMNDFTHIEIWDNKIKKLLRSKKKDIQQDTSIENNDNEINQYQLSIIELIYTITFTYYFLSRTDKLSRSIILNNIPLSWSSYIRNEIQNNKIDIPYFLFNDFYKYCYLYDDEHTTRPYNQVTLKFLLDLLFVVYDADTFERLCTFVVKFPTLLSEEMITEIVNVAIQSSDAQTDKANSLVILTNCISQCPHTIALQIIAQLMKNNFFDIIDHIDLNTSDILAYDITKMVLHSNIPSYRLNNLLSEKMIPKLRLEQENDSFIFQTMVHGNENIQKNILKSNNMRAHALVSPFVLTEEIRNVISTWDDYSDELVSYVLRYHPTLQEFLYNHVITTQGDNSQYREMIFTDIELNKNPKKRIEMIHKYGGIIPLSLFKIDNVENQRIQLGLHLGSIEDIKSREELLIKWLPQLHKDLSQEIINGIQKESLIWDQHFTSHTITIPLAYCLLKNRNISLPIAEENGMENVEDNDLVAWANRVYPEPEEYLVSLCYSVLEREEELVGDLLQIAAYLFATLQRQEATVTLATSIRDSVLKDYTASNSRDDIARKAILVQSAHWAAQQPENVSEWELHLKLPNFDWRLDGNRLNDTLETYFDGLAITEHYDLSYLLPFFAGQLRTKFSTASLPVKLICQGGVLQVLLYGLATPWKNWAYKGLGYVDEAVKKAMEKNKDTYRMEFREARQIYNLLTFLKNAIVPSAYKEEDTKMVDDIMGTVMSKVGPSTEDTEMVDDIMGTIMSKVGPSMDGEEDEEMMNVSSTCDDAEEDNRSLTDMAITVDELPAIPPLICAFVANCVGVLLRPEHSLYLKVGRFFTARAHIDLQDIPMFYELFCSADPEDKKWILKVLRRGGANWHTFGRRHVIQMVLSSAQSTLCDFGAWADTLRFLTSVNLQKSTKWGRGQLFDFGIGDWITGETRKPCDNSRLGLIRLDKLTDFLETLIPQNINKMDDTENFSLLSAAYAIIQEGERLQSSVGTQKVIKKIFPLVVRLAEFRTSPIEFGLPLLDCFNKIVPVQQWSSFFNWTSNTLCALVILGLRSSSFLRILLKSQRIPKDKMDANVVLRTLNIIFQALKDNNLVAGSNLQDCERVIDSDMLMIFLLTPYQDARDQIKVKKLCHQILYHQKPDPTYADSENAVQSMDNDLRNDDRLHADKRMNPGETVKIDDAASEAQNTHAANSKKRTITELDETTGVLDSATPKKKKKRKNKEIAEKEAQQIPDDVTFPQKENKEILENQAQATFSDITFSQKENKEMMRNENILDNATSCNDSLGNLTQVTVMKKKKKRKNKEIVEKEAQQTPDDDTFPQKENKEILENQTPATFNDIAFSQKDCKEIVGNATMLDNDISLNNSVDHVTEVKAVKKKKKRKIKN